MCNPGRDPIPEPLPEIPVAHYPGPLPLVNEYHSNCDLADVAKLLRASDRPVAVLTHAKPDGDAFGSVIALAATLGAMGRHVSACFVPPILGNLLELGGSKLAGVWNDRTKLPEVERLILVDTGAWSQVGPLRSYIEERLERTIIIDHHLSGDIPAGHRYIDGDAAATCEIVASLLELMQSDHAPIDKATAQIVADSLFVGIASDTGWFRFSNTRPQTHQLAADLIGRGVDHADLYRRLEQTERPQKLALLTRALSSLQLLSGGRAAVMVLRRSDFEETEALEEETERLIDIPQQVGSIEVIALLSEKTQHQDGSLQTVTRLSFRSKPGKAPINVAELAGQFGGGGHARAAGATVEDRVDWVLPKVCASLERAAAYQPLG